MKKVQFVHFREMQLDKGNNMVPKPRGGATVVYRPVENEERPKHFYGVSICSPKTNFCRKDGREQAMESSTQEGVHTHPDLLTMDEFIDHARYMVEKEEVRVAAVHKRRPRMFSVWVRSAHKKRSEAYRTLQAAYEHFKDNPPEPFEQNEALNCHPKER